MANKYIKNPKTNYKRTAVSSAVETMVMSPKNTGEEFWNDDMVEWVQNDPVVRSYYELYLRGHDLDHLKTELIKSLLETKKRQHRFIQEFAQKHGVKWYESGGKYFLET